MQDPGKRKKNWADVQLNRRKDARRRRRRRKKEKERRRGGKKPWEDQWYVKRQIGNRRRRERLGRRKSCVMMLRSRVTHGVFCARTHCISSLASTRFSITAAAARS